jgi:hypothetical protein
MRREAVIYLCLAAGSWGAGWLIAGWINRARDQAVPCTVQRPDFSGTWRMEPCAPLVSPSWGPRSQEPGRVPVK